MRPPQHDVLGIEPGGDTVKPAALGEIADGLFGLAEFLNGLCADLDVAHQVDLANCVDAHFLNHLVALFNPQHTAGLADAESLRIEVERSAVDARGNEQARLAGRRLLGDLASAVEEAELFASEVGGTVLQPAGFVGHADTDKGTAGHLGESTSGGGIMGAAAVRHAPAMARSASAMVSLSKTTRTRCRVF